jgi:hypothetical protein
LTQQQLADLAGVGLNFVYQLEKNKQTVQLDCTLQVLEALGYELAPRPLLRATPVVEAPDGRQAARPKSPWD